MRKLLFVFTVGVMFVCCSGSKYTYNFDRHFGKTNDRSSDVSNNSLSIAQEVATITLTKIQDEIVLASTSSREIITQPIKKINSSDKYSKQFSLGIAKEKQKKLLNNNQEFRAINKSHESIKEGGDSNKNGLAVIGFIFSVVGLFVFWPLCVLGFVLSAIGLKSERRGLAMAGFIIGIIGAIIVWIAADL